MWLLYIYRVANKSYLSLVLSLSLIDSRVVEINKCKSEILFQVVGIPEVDLQIYLVDI